MKSNNPRIIILSSVAHFLTYKNGINFEDIECKQYYNRFQSYGTSKLALLLFAHELHLRYNRSGLISIAVHPGVIQTEITR